MKLHRILVLQVLALALAFQTVSAQPAVGRISPSQKLPAAKANAAKTEAPEEKPGPNPRFYEVQKKLDPGGTFYLYADLKGVFENLAASAHGLIDQAATQARAEEQDEVRLAHQIIDAVAKHSSLLQIEDFGVSVIPDGDLNRVKVFLRMPGEAEGLRRVFAGKPAARKLLHVAPENTVLFLDTDFSLGALYDVIVKAHREAVKGTPEEQDLEAQATETEKQTGFPVRRLIRSLEGEMGVALSLDDSSTAMIPSPDGAAVQIPKPSLLLGLEVKDETLYDGVKRMLLQAGLQPTTITLAQDASGFTLALPPVGFPLLPTFAYQKPFFYFATDPRLLSDGLKRLAEGKGGLAAQAEFVETMKDLPRENNGVSFVSRRLMETVGRYLAESAPEAAVVAQTLKESKGSVGVRINDPDGVLLVSRTEHSGGQLVAGGMIAPLGIMTAVAIPGFIRAREVSRRNACQENLIKIDGAKSQWALENNKSGEDEPTWDDLVKSDGTGYLRVMPVCPCGGEYSINAVNEAPTCSYDGGEFAHEYPQY